MYEREADTKRAKSKESAQGGDSVIIAKQPSKTGLSLVSGEKRSLIKKRFQKRRRDCVSPLAVLFQNHTGILIHDFSWLAKAALRES